MTTSRNSFLAVMQVAVILFGFLLCGRADELPKEDAALLTAAQSQFKPLPKDAGTTEFPITPERVHLGRMLFFDPRMSDDGTVSCYRCHLAGLYATDGLPKSIGGHDHHLPRNASTVFNSGLYIAEHWRGEFANVEEQAQRGLIGPAFANPDYAKAMARIKAIPGYSELFKRAFPDETEPVTERNWGRAIGAYERTLMTPSRFDDYLGGKQAALTAPERRGLQVFLDAGCVDCHNGAGVGGGAFEKFGVMEDYWKATGSRDIDQGRIDVTKNAADQYIFKVPGLRNVEMTPPYFHDGSVKTLPEAVRIMARVQLGKTLSDNDAAAIVAFLKSLTGTLPKQLVEAPVLPAAGFELSP
jgi:cytochrome c peroxidase